jgi:signal recognition particle subunit SRP54
VDPTDRLYVADAMTGQDAVRSAGEFNARSGVSGVVLTKLDGDARGGAALSVVGVVGVPIAFVGVGERPQDFEPFHADRLVSRLLGMGDILTLIERAEEALDDESREKLEQKTRLDDFTLEDFGDQLRTIKKMGPLDQVLGMIPGMGAIKEMNAQRAQMDGKQVERVQAIISSMTHDERRNHQLINGSRRKRIARGSGTSVEEVNRVLKQFVEMRKVLKTMSGIGGGSKGKQRLMNMLRGR